MRVDISAKNASLAGVGAEKISSARGMPWVGMEGSLATYVYTCEARWLHVFMNDDNDCD